MKVIKSPTLIDKSGADLTLSKEQFMAVMNKDTLEKEAKIKEAFKVFVENPILDLSNFDFFAATVVVEIFMYEEERGIMGTDGKPMKDRMVFPVAKVVAVGPESFHKVGNFVKLKDFEASEIPNPAYELWAKNNMDNGSLKKVGEAPPAVVSNFHVIHGKKCFNVNPIQSKNDFADIKLFVLYEPNIECIIKDPKKLI